MSLNKYVEWKNLPLYDFTYIKLWKSLGIESKSVVA